MLKRALAELVFFGGLMLWRSGANATMPALAEDVRLALPPLATAVSFKSGTWACTGEEFKLQLLDTRATTPGPW